MAAPLNDICSQVIATTAKAYFIILRGDLSNQRQQDTLFLVDNWY
ncbi:hypothetical protein [Psychrobacter sp. TAE2020]|nr:hypothetical protein [Psychrobacter sp. TAE2020]